MIAICKGPEPAALTAQRSWRLARLRLAWLDAGEPEGDAARGFVAEHSTALDGGYDVARGELLREAHRKCAWCERSLGDSVPIDHIRPRRARRADEHSGYFWLTWSFDNLIVVCVTCNLLKGSAWPVDGPRACPWQGVVGESPAVIDPVHDDPAAHIAFDRRRGKWAPVGLTDRGRETLAMLASQGLDEDHQNRIAALEAHVVDFLEPLDGAPGFAGRWRRWVQREAGPGAPFAALVRAWMAQRFPPDWCAERGVSLPPRAEHVPPAEHPLFEPRPELSDLPERLALRVRALGKSCTQDELDEVVLGLLAHGLTSAAALAEVVPRAESTLGDSLSRLRAAGRLAPPST